MQDNRFWIWSRARRQAEHIRPWPLRLAHAVPAPTTLQLESFISFNCLGFEWRQPGAMFWGMVPDHKTIENDVQTVT